MLSEKICELRKKHSYSQEELAELLGVSRQAISKWESGKAVPSPDKLVKLSDLFGVSVDSLIRDIDGITPKDFPETSGENKRENDENGRSRSGILRTAGVVLCAAGALLLCVPAIISAASPRIADNLSQSSVITLDGLGISFVPGIVLAVLGVFLVFKKK